MYNYKPTFFYTYTKRYSFLFILCMCSIVFLLLISSHTDNLSVIQGIFVSILTGYVITFIFHEVNIVYEIKESQDQQLHAIAFIYMILEDCIELPENISGEELRRLSTPQVIDDFFISIINGIELFDKIKKINHYQLDGNFLEIKKIKYQYDNNFENSLIRHGNIHALAFRIKHRLDNVIDNFSDSVEIKRTIESHLKNYRKLLATPEA